MILLNMDTAIFYLIGMIVLVMFGPPLVFLIIGIILRKAKPDRSKVFFILFGVYLLIAGGICGVLMS